jgi:hypothetical protein
MIKDKQTLLLNELEEIISQLAQQTDSKTTNLQVYIEEQHRALEDKDRRRWIWFVTIATTVLLAIGILIFEMWERQYDRITVLGREVTASAQQITYLKDQMLRRYELRDKISEIEKQRDLTRDKNDAELAKLITKLEKDLDKELAEGKRRDKTYGEQAELIKKLEVQLKEAQKGREKQE